MTQMLVRPTEDLKDRLQIEAQRRGLTLNALVLQILWDWVKQRKLELETEPNTEEESFRPLPR